MSAERTPTSTPVMKGAGQVVQPGGDADDEADQRDVVAEVRLDGEHGHQHHTRDTDQDEAQREGQVEGALAVDSHQPGDVRFWTTARIARPVQVLLRKSWKLTRITPAMTKQASWMMPTLIFGVK